MTFSIDEMFDFGQTLVKKKEYKPPPDPIDWISLNFIDPISKGPIRLEPYQKRILREALTMDSEGYSKYNLVVWSQTKKSGKTALAAAVGSYVAQCIESPNEIVALANDQEQSAGRIFGSMLPTLKQAQWTVPVSSKSQIRSPICYGPSGSVVKAITTNYEKEAGANNGISLWSELWAYKGERLTRLWEEMTPPPTRKFSMRWVETYAGFINENILLQNIYMQVFSEFEKKGKQSKLQKNVEKIWDDLPVYRPNPYTLIFWDHEHRMPWQTGERGKIYYNSQRDTLRASTFSRLHGNYWVESKDNFISHEMWYRSVRQEVKRKKAFYALDASKDNDSVALIGCIRVGDMIHTVDIHIWETEPGKEVNFKDIEDKIIEIKKYIQTPLYYDPYQAVKLAQDLRSKGIQCEEFKQGNDRIKSDTFLYKLYKEGKIINPDNSILKLHVLGAAAKVYADDRVRIVKHSDDYKIEGRDNLETEEKIKPKKTDGIVAQSMAAYKAYMNKSGGWAGL